jgi:hypothetical protein
VTTTDTHRELIGCEVDVACCDGARQRGHLLGLNRRSLWLVTGGDEDQFIPWADVADLRAAS